MPYLETEKTITDKRLLRGSKTRKLVLQYAADLASLEGLENVSFGRLSADTKISKSGIQALFKTKEQLQLAIVEYARTIFIDSVIRPAWSAHPGSARLWALLEHWYDYASTPLLAGGCFRVANLAYFDSMPGAVHDELLSDQRKWIEIIANELRNAESAGEIVGLDAELAAFEIDALLSAANIALRAGNHDAMSMVYRIVEKMLGQPCPTSLRCTSSRILPSKSTASIA